MWLAARARCCSWCSSSRRWDGWSAFRPTRPAERDSRASTRPAPSLAHYREILTDPYFAKLGWVTVQVGVIITLVTMAVALPFAIYIYRSRGIYKRFLLMAVILPKLTNLLVLMYGVLLLLGDTGFINQVLMGRNPDASRCRCSPTCRRSSSAKS